MTAFSAATHDRDLDAEVLLGAPQLIFLLFYDFDEPSRKSVRAAAGRIEENGEVKIVLSRDEREVIAEVTPTWQRI